jgi:hypothetical protein
MVEALELYLKEGVPLGDFLAAIVANDFVEATGRADMDNLGNLPAFGAWLYNECPRQSWGSREAYEAWLEMHAKRRAAAATAARDAIGPANTTAPPEAGNER